MSDIAAPNRSDSALQLPADAYWHLVRTLRLTLPPPPTDSAEDLRRRDHAAIARISALVPANAAEAGLAAQFVAASEQWKDCLRLAHQPETTPERAAKCRAQAMAMMRQANSALRLLLRLQNARRKLEADATAADRAAWTEHCAIGFMAEALPGSLSTQSAPAANAGPEAPPPGPELAANSPSSQAGEGQFRPTPGERRESHLLEAAEEYAAICPERAALIGRMGRLPDDLSFGPPDDDIVEALVSSRPPPSAAPVSGHGAGLDRAFAEAA